jgi:hypothetical protein
MKLSSDNFSLITICALCALGFDGFITAQEQKTGEKKAPSGEPALPAPERQQQDVSQFVESLRVKEAGQPYGIYRPALGQTPTLYASCNAALVRYIIGDLKISAPERQQWIEHINSFQDPMTGKYPNARFLHLFGTAIRALNALGGKPKYPPVFLREWDDQQATRKWMEKFDWKFPWEPSICILHVAAPRATRQAEGAKPGPMNLDAPPVSSAPKDWLPGVLDWLDSRQDPKTGFWGPDRGASNFDGMGATFHFLPLYEAANRPMLRRPEMVAAILAIQKSKYGTWGGVYADMDAVSLLVYFYLRAESQRAEIQKSLHTSINLLFKTAYTPKSGAFGDLANTLGACEHLAEAARALKDHPYAGLKWNRAWDWQLWRCSW